MRTTSRTRSGVASEDPPNLRTLNSSRENRIGFFVVVAIGETVDGCVLRVERLEDREQLRRLQDRESLGMEVQQLDVAVALPDGHIFPRDRADAGAVEIGHLLEVEQDPPPFAAECVHPLDERCHAVFEDQTALEIQNGDAPYDALGDLHKRGLILASPSRYRAPSDALDGSPPRPGTP